MRNRFRLVWKTLRARLSGREKRAIEETIRSAEQRTSAEIRVVVERQCPLGMDPVERAVALFERFGMTATRERNGVLIYIALRSRKYAVVGDKGIHEKVGDDFWKTVSQEMQKHFIKGDIAEGICAGIQRVGYILSRYFPRSEGDINELPDKPVEM